MLQIVMVTPPLPLPPPGKNYGNLKKNGMAGPIQFLLYQRKHQDTIEKMIKFKYESPVAYSASQNCNMNLSYLTEVYSVLSFSSS